MFKNLAIERMQFRSFIDSVFNIARDNILNHAFK